MIALSKLNTYISDSILMNLIDDTKDIEFYNGVCITNINKLLELELVNCSSSKLDVLVNYAKSMPCSGTYCVIIQSSNQKELLRLESIIDRKLFNHWINDKIKLGDNHIIILLNELVFNDNILG